MYFRQILHEDLGCASYILADEREAVVVDPKWEIDEYLRAAQRAGAGIGHVFETHMHADHVSGRRRLASATGAVLHVPSDPTGRSLAGCATEIFCTWGVWRSARLRPLVTARSISRSW